MSYATQNAGIKRGGRTLPAVILVLLFLAVITAITICFAQKGSIVILENPDGSGFSMNLKEWTAEDKCDLFLKKGEVLEVEVVVEEGDVDLSILGANGAEPYMGNDLGSMRFTVTVPETDRYIVHVAGKRATAKITVKK